MWLKILSDREVRFAVFDEYLMRYHVSESSIMTNTERRIRCCLIVAGRYATELKNRPGGVYRNLWFRTLIVHAEGLPRAWSERSGYSDPLPLCPGSCGNNLETPIQDRAIACEYAVKFLKHPRKKCIQC